MSTELQDFSTLGLSDQVYQGIKSVGYETPSEIQAKIIPSILSGRDVVGQAQTGTGKTAAFALPLLSHINVKSNTTQVLVMTPTRELAMQVAEAFEKYAAHIEGFRARAIYGGQDIRVQLKHLKRGVHVVVGTPGRIIDHLKRQSLKLDSMKCIVLDEADEMLKMGFVEDIDTILSKAPKERQTALFSATMPKAIQKIAKTYLDNPEHVTIELRTTTCENIHQRVCYVQGPRKVDALHRLLQVEDFEAMLIFVRTKNETSELATKLRAHGHYAEALSGDVKQSQREKIIERLRSGKANIVVATDVAARGIDVERITHVINYDIPNDVESYIHRIGRTGRAGRKGDAILFVTSRERGMLKTIEKVTNQKIDEMRLPTIGNVNAIKIEKFKDEITEVLATEEWHAYTEVVRSFVEDYEVDPSDMAAAICVLIHKRTPLFVEEGKPIEDDKPERGRRRGGEDRGRKSFKGKRRSAAPRGGSRGSEKGGGKRGDFKRSNSKSRKPSRKKANRD